MGKQSPLACGGGKQKSMGRVDRPFFLPVIVLSIVLSLDFNRNCFLTRHHCVCLTHLSVKFLGGRQKRRKRENFSFCQALLSGLNLLCFSSYLLVKLETTVSVLALLSTYFLFPFQHKTYLPSRHHVCQLSLSIYNPVNFCMFESNSPQCLFV